MNSHSEYETLPVILIRLMEVNGTESGLGECHCGVAGDGLHRRDENVALTFHKTTRRPSRCRGSHQRRIHRRRNDRRCRAGPYVQPGRWVLQPGLITPNVVLTQHCIFPIAGYQQRVDCGSSEFGSKYKLELLYVTTATTWAELSQLRGRQGSVDSNWRVWSPVGERCSCMRERVALLI